MATKTFNASFMGQWRGSTGTYYGGGSPIRVGGASKYRNFIGIPPEVREAILTSKTTPTLSMQAYVTDSAEFFFGAHSLTSNPASGAIPSWTALGESRQWNSGAWRTIDLTSFFMTPYKNGVYQGIQLYGNDGADEVNLGLADNTTARPVQFIVTGTWNTAPTVPVITYPIGGEVVDQSLTVKWNASMDADGNALQYRVGINVNGLWHFFYTNFGATQLTINTGVYEESFNAYVSVQADDGTDVSAPRFSQAFTIQHNQAPAKPTNLFPANGTVRDRTKSNQVSWRHNDDGEQAGYELEYRLKGATVWTSLTSGTFENSTQEYHFMPINLPLGTIEWHVRTKDQSNLSSDWSNVATFESVNPSNAPIITFPSGSGAVNTNTVTFTWSSLAQAEYEIEVTNLATNVVVLTATRVSTAKAHTGTYTFLNNTNYRVRLRVRDSGSLLWSNWSSKEFLVSFTPPTAPTINSVALAGEGVANLFYTVGSGGATPTQKMDIYRREYSSANIEPWLQVGEDIPLSGAFLDYTLASGVPYEFKLVASNNDNSTSIESAVFPVTIEFESSFLSEADNLSNIHVMALTNTREEDYELESELAQYAGRNQAVREFGEHEQVVITVEWELDTYAEVRQFKKMLQRRGVLLFRDGAGRRYWVTTDGVSIKDKEVDGFVLSCTLMETQYYEDLNL